MRAVVAGAVLRAGLQPQIATVGLHLPGGAAVGQTDLEDLPQPRAQAPVSANIARLILGLMERDRDRRYGDAEEVLAAIREYAGAIVLVTHDEGAVHALEPDRVLILPDGVEDLWTPDYADLVSLA